jgi:putative DNA primase/helicase
VAGSLDDVVTQMLQHGIDVPARVDLAQAFAGVIRWRPSSEKKVKKTAWARLFEYRAPSGKVYITGAYGLRGDQWQVESTSREWTVAERAEWAEQRKAAAKAAEAERQKDAESAAAKAARLWEQGREEGTSEYLDRKKVRAFGVRFGFNRRLMVPVRDIEGTLQGLQWISPDGEKIFGTGTRKEGRFHLIGEVSTEKPLAFAEGYATGATVHMATGWPVVVCFDAGNIEPVVAQWRRLYPDLDLVIAADDDRHLMQRLCERLARLGVHATPAELGKLTEPHEWTVPGGDAGADEQAVVLKAGWSKDTAGVPCINGTITVGSVTHLLKLENAGRARAMAAARKHRAKVALPAFAEPASSGTDWNDLHVAQGLEACEGPLRAVLASVPLAKNAADDRPQGGGGKGRGTALPPQDTNEPKFVDALSRWTLLYGTTTVWDEEVRQVLRIESLKLAYGRLVDWWLQHEKRHMIPQDHLVFDPTGRCKPPEYVNLFKGLPLEPDPNGQCNLIVEHLYNLCQENDALFHWVCCWLALPLQQLGTKMHTALVLHGRTEGTGKSLFTTIMRKIYGVHSRTINQRQLETEFNGWLSGQMFVVAEEVVSRQDRAHLQGVLQDLITGDTVNINEKNMPLRQESNYANFVFQSNQQVPVLLNRTDRRHTVIRIEREHPEEYFDKILQQMANGGIEAFYAWLLNYDIGDFTKRTRPFVNRDRMHLITLGMSADQRFFTYWESGVAGVPFVTCPASDLYTAFKAWCKVNGERFIPNHTVFGRTVSEELERMKAPEKRKVRYWAHSEKVVVDGDWSQDTVQMQGVVYFVHAAIERRTLVEDQVTDADDADGQPAASQELEDVTVPEARDKRIKLFQAALHTLIGSARRSL